MLRLLGVLFLLGVIGMLFALWFGWIDVSKTGPDDSAITVRVEEDKMREDTARARDAAADLARGAKDRLDELGEDDEGLEAVRSTRGTVARVDAATLTISGADEVEVAFPLDDDVKVFIDGETATLTAVRPGDEVVLVRPATRDLVTEIRVERRGT